VKFTTSNGMGILSGFVGTGDNISSGKEKSKGYGTPAQV
jgi:hypothetical protein